MSDAPDAVVARLRATFDSGRTRDAGWRRAQLHGLRRMLRERDADFARALRQDLGKPALEAFVTETAIVRSEIALALRQLRRWMRGENSRATAMAASRSRTARRHAKSCVARCIVEGGRESRSRTGPRSDAISCLTAANTSACETSGMEGVRSSYDGIRMVNTPRAAA